MNFLHVIKKNTRVIFFSSIGVLLIICLLCAGSFFFISEKKKNIDETMVKIQTEYEKNEKINLVKHLMRDIGTEREKLDELFVKEEDIIAFVEVVEKLGEHSGVGLTLNSMDVSNKENHSFEMKVGTKGGWSETMYFLSLVEALPFYIKVNTANLTQIDVSGKNSEKYWSGDFVITLLSFINKEDEKN